MKKVTKKKKIAQITLRILEEISRILEITAGSILDPYELQRKMRYSGTETSEFFDRLRSAGRSGYIKITRDKKNQLSVKLTNKGKIKVLESGSDHGSDGRWRIISFDIPENLRYKRDTFRQVIKRIGFIQVQKSLWVSSLNKADQIELVIDDLKINQYVAYFIVEKTDINEYLSKKLFGKVNKSKNQHL